MSGESIGFPGLIQTVAPPTFRDRRLSMFQSAIEDMAGAVRARTPGARPGLDNALVNAASAICQLKTNSDGEIPANPPPLIGSQAWTCARGVYGYLDAASRGDDAAMAAARQDVLTGSPYDIQWADTLLEYLGYFGLTGSVSDIPYIRAATVGKHVITIPSDARIALIADWGMGTPMAVDLLRQVRAQSPDIVIHLGDIYYSGTASECDTHFRAIVDDVLDRANTKIPVFSLAGNHDMYSGGAGFYSLIKTLNPPPFKQPASFFCLRSADAAWQFLAMDTGLHDFNPFSVTENLTRLESDEESWHLARLAETNAHTILLSHHQLFSAHSQIGPETGGILNPINPNLLASYKKFNNAGKIAAWFWGHEHNLCVFEPYAGLDRGRCIGHGGIPVFQSENPYGASAKIADPPRLVEKVRLDAFSPGAMAEPLYAHGFAMIALESSTRGASVSYFESSRPGVPIYTEHLP
jgi:hypothetical protein